MIVLDAYAIVALLRDEPAAEYVEQLLAERPGASLTVIGVAEVLDRLVRLTRVDEDQAVLDLAQVGLDEPVPLDSDAAHRAGLLRAKHYQRRTRAVSLADCIAADTARLKNQPLATSDPHLLELCTDEGIPVIVLPDTAGNWWSPDSK
jgi:predicted nucleic acid-binding protein